MGSVAVLRERCRDMGIGLRVSPTGIKVEFGGALVTPELRAEIVANRVQLAGLLQAEADYERIGREIWATDDSVKATELINGPYAEAGDHMASYRDAAWWEYVGGPVYAGGDD